MPWIKCKTFCGAAFSHKVNKQIAMSNGHVTGVTMRTHSYHKLKLHVLAALLYLDRPDYNLKILSAILFIKLYQFEVKILIQCTYVMPDDKY